MNFCLSLVLFLIHQNDPTLHLVPAKWDHITLLNSYSRLFKIIEKLITTSVRTCTLRALSEKAFACVQDLFLTRNDVILGERENQKYLAMDIPAFKTASVNSREDIALSSSCINVSVLQRSRVAGFHFSARLVFSGGSDGLARDRAGQLG